MAGEDVLAQNVRIRGRFDLHDLQCFVDRSLCSFQVSLQPSSMGQLPKPHDLHHPIPGLSQHSEHLFERRAGIDVFAYI
jgi:hypothetical protein